MSLINEALKRAQAEQALQAAGIKPAHLRAAPAPVAPVPRKASPLVATVVAAMVVAIGVAVLAMVKLNMPSPHRASADARLVDPAPQPATDAPTLADADPAPQATLIDNEQVHPGQAARAGGSGAAASRQVSQAGSGSDGPAKASRTRGAPNLSKPLAESYVLSGIMHSAGADTALINGKMVHVGQGIGQAVVTRINENSVDLDVDGRQVTLGL
jgi:hypothetical protein